jgi:hypothetical protein
MIKLDLLACLLLASLEIRWPILILKTTTMMEIIIVQSIVQHGITDWRWDSIARTHKGAIECWVPKPDPAIDPVLIADIDSSGSSWQTVIRGVTVYLEFTLVIEATIATWKMDSPLDNIEDFENRDFHYPHRFQWRCLSIWSWSTVIARSDAILNHPWNSRSDLQKHCKSR